MAAKRSKLVEALDKLLALYLKETNRKHPDNPITMEAAEVLEQAKRAA